MSNGIMDNPGDAKYGFTHEQIIEGFKILKEKGAKHFGVHAFLASNTVTNEYYPKLARQSVRTGCGTAVTRPDVISSLSTFPAVSVCLIHRIRRRTISA